MASKICWVVYVCGGGGLFFNPSPGPPSLQVVPYPLLWKIGHMGTLGTAVPVNLCGRRRPDLRRVLTTAAIEEPGREEGRSLRTAPGARHGWRREGDNALVVGGVGWVSRGRQVLLVKHTLVAPIGVLQVGEREAYAPR